MYLDRLEFRRDPLRRFDSRCRVVSAFLLIAAAVNIRNAVPLAAVIVLCPVILFRDIRVVLWRLLAVNAIAVALWLPVAAGLSPAAAALLYTLRINAAALLCMTFVSPLKASAVAAALQGMKVPSKLVSLFVLTWRYIFLLYGSLATSLLSMRQRLRGRSAGRPQAGMIREWRALAAVFAGALVRAMIRAEAVSIAMNARGFDGVFPKTVEFRWKKADSVLVALSAAMSEAALFCSIIIR